MTTQIEQYTASSGRTLPLLRLGLGYGAVVDETTTVWAVLALVSPNRPKLRSKAPTLRRLSFAIDSNVGDGMRGLCLTRSSAKFLAERPDCPEALREIIRDQMERS